MRILVAGGAGFIGSAFVRGLLGSHPGEAPGLAGAYPVVERVLALDLLTYAGNLANLAPVADDPRYRFVQGDIADGALVTRLLREERIEAIVNFAAETHVDRALLDPEAFVRTDVLGTRRLLEAARAQQVDRFVQVSTDEVYGEVLEGAAHEDSPLAPRNPYSASKAGGDLMALAYANSYGLPVCVTRGSNTFGPYQFPEKFIPLFVTRALRDEPLPLYGDGRQVREWLAVEDHAAGIGWVLQHGQAGQVYNLGGGQERENRELAARICDHLGKPGSLIRPVADRPGHDRRYALDCGKLRALGWAPVQRFEDTLTRTIDWYVAHPEWWRPLVDDSAEYQGYFARQYGQRLATS